MTASFRRTLSMMDLLDASDDEMDTLLPSESGTAAKSDTAEPGGPSSVNANPEGANALDTAPVLSLTDDLNWDVNQQQASDSQATESSMPRNKSVHFEDFDEGFRKAGRDLDMFTTLQNIKYEVDGINGVVRENVVRLLNREEMFEGLLDRSEHMNLAGDMYMQSTEMLKRKMTWRRRRTRLVLTAFGIICACILIVPLLTRWFEQ